MGVGGWSKNIPPKSPISGCNGRNHDFFRQIELHVRQTQQIGTFFEDVGLHTIIINKLSFFSEILRGGGENCDMRPSTGDSFGAF